MNASMMALAGFAAWTVLLVFVVLLYRTVLVFTGKKKANSWPRGEMPADDLPIMVRIQHAHLNCLEGLPIFAAIILAAAMSGKLYLTNPIAPWVLAARLAQSATHLIGTTHWLVFVRANFFAVQLLLYAWMLWQLAH